MNKSKKVLKFLSSPVDKVTENGMAGPNDEDIAKFVFAALKGEHQSGGVKVRAEKIPMKGAPLDLDIDYPFQGKLWKVKARIPVQALRVVSVE